MGICTSSITKRKKGGSASGYNSLTIQWAVCKVSCPSSLLPQRQVRQLHYYIKWADYCEDHILQLAVDLDRQCIYSLTETGIISVYRTNGDKSIECIQTITGIYKSASDKAPGNPLITPSSFKIVAIEVIPPAESRVGIQFVALTSNGIRLFFSSASVGLSYSYGSMNNGRTLNLTHVRMPPTSLPHPDVPASTQSSNEPQSTFNITGVDNLCYSLGVTLCAQPAESDARDFLLCLSPDLTRVGSFGQVNQQPVEPAMYATTSSGPQRNPLVEYASLLPIPGRTWAMAPLHQKLSSGLSAMHELSVQVTEPSRQFMVLTSAGITFLAKRRPLDYLQDVIEEYHADGNVQPLLHFRDRYVHFNLVLHTI
jgi:nuclear pore complex protein Nup155